MSGLGSTGQVEGAGREAGSSPSKEPRRIVHVDMDVFYAQIEQRDFPERYAGDPIEVGGDPPRGVVQTASYEARPYGVHSAQPAAGVGSSKFVAKVASDQDKPDGLTVIRPEEQMEFIAGLPIADFHGIGPVTEEKMEEMGIRAGADLQDASEQKLRRRFGKRGGYFKKLAMGKDDRPVRPDRERKSVGAERTFPEDIAETEEMLARLEPIAERVAERLQEAGRKGRTVTLKLKSKDHEVSTRQTTLRRTVRSKEILLRLTERLLGRPHPPKEPVRLLGLSVSSLTTEEGGEQLSLNFRRA